MPSGDQGESSPRGPTRRRRRRGTRALYPGAIVVRPGRFFRRNKYLHHVRLVQGAYALGDADWLLYRRRSCPYRIDTWNRFNYMRGFAASKALTPRPAWPAINW